MNRRNLLSAAPAVLMLPGAGIAGASQAAVPSPDAGLIALCAQLDSLERAWCATDLEDDGADPEREAIQDAQAPVVDAICAQPPRTLPGFLAVARSLAFWDAEAIKDGGPGAYTNERLLAALLRGILGETPAPPPAANPDAELLALCATYQHQHAEAHNEANPAWEAAGAAKYGTYRAVGALTAATAAGHRAKAAVAVAMIEEAHEGDDGDPQALFAADMLRDWLGKA